MKNYNGKLEPVWTADDDYLFCDECKEWFEQQENLQMELIDAQIEKEKREGTFYSNPITQKVLKENQQKIVEWEKEISLSFGKSPQE